ncbi:bifunctional diguanylate cyclase/phosphodiesterase [Deinococcus sp. QL22]|uniref:putative bifunctional diguanylate cyclase/phosphodiesterase n=1 Tax=Deinococcus sp. QL22 TaxID=2939437 RepID=UPI0020171BA2|nr:EAL domain-containing protein [Deinococcus sp. QL22]UQN07357.1 EAL domain-containing protein [Deinococcus sp. QL22]
MTRQQAETVVGWLQDQQSQLNTRTRSWAALPDPLLMAADLLSTGDLQGMALLSGGRVTTAMIASDVPPADWQPGAVAPRQRFAIRGNRVWLLARAKRLGDTELLLMRQIDAGVLSPAPFVTRVSVASEPAKLLPGQATISAPDDLSIAAADPRDLNSVNDDAARLGSSNSANPNPIVSVQSNTSVQSVRTFAKGQGGRALEVWVSQPRTLHDQGVRAVRTASLTVLVLILACIVMALCLLDSLVFARLARLRRFVQRIETEPDTAARLHLGQGEDELHLVARALNLTLDRVTGDHNIMRAQGETLRLIAENGNVDDVLRVIQAALERRSPGAPAELQSFGPPTLAGMNYMDPTIWAVSVRGRAGDRYGQLRLTYPGVLPEDIASEAAWMAELLGVAAEQERLRGQLSFHAYNDELTGLPNRRGLLRTLARTVPDALERGTPVAVLYLDLDRFKRLNDTLGHAAGDELLRQVAARIGRACCPNDQAARLGGDEFVIVLPRAGTEAEVAQIAQRLVTTLETPFEVFGHAFQPTASIGVALAPRDGHDPEQLLRLADLAMVHAKARGPGRVAFFTPDLEDALLDRVQIENDLRETLRTGGLTLAYQPLVNLSTGRAEGLEALLRWIHPLRGPVPPSIFIPIAEDAGLIGLLGDWVLREATTQLAAWRSQGIETHVAINVSAVQLLTPNFVVQVKAALEDNGLPPSALALEVTESLLMDGTPGSAAHTHLMKLSNHGVRVWVDDFGTGYSSLSYLHRLPIHAVKVDRSFVMGLRSGPEAERIIETIVTLAHHLDLKVVAEGVEQDWQAEVLKRLGCDHAQGYFYARPAAAGQVPRLFATPLGQVLQPALPPSQAK